MRVYEAIARARYSMLNAKDPHWFDTFSKELNDLLSNYLPHGSGIDGETAVCPSRSKDDRIVIASNYHLMNENGFYVRWIKFDIVIKPNLQWGMDLSVKGQFGKDQDVKEYLAELFHEALYAKIPTI